MKSPRFLYIAGPYRGKAGNSDHGANVNAAAKVWSECWRRRVYAICPHWSCVQQTICPEPDIDWLAYTMGQLMLCDAVYRMPGESSGSDAEAAAARQQGIPVFDDLGVAIAYMLGVNREEACGCGEGDCSHCLKACSSQARRRCCHNAAIAQVRGPADGACRRDQACRHCPVR